MCKNTVVGCFYMNEAGGIITITDRRKIELTGIKAVSSFDEYVIALEAVNGRLTIEGERLNITVLDLDRGVVCAEGIINATVFADKEDNTEKGFFSGLFGNRNR